MSPLDRFLIVNKNGLKRVPVARTLAARYLLGRARISAADITFDTAYSASYALISEKKSPRFRRIMDHMDAYIGAGSYGPNKYWEYPWVLANLKLQPNIKILDAGCGTSPPQFVVARLGAIVHGIDPNEDVEWHGIDRRLAGRFGCAIEYRIEGLDAISYADNSFDRVCCISVIEHCRAELTNDERMTPQTGADESLQRTMMREMVRVLKPGGLLVMTTDFNFPRTDCRLDSNVDVANLLAVDGVQRVGVRCPEAFYGEPGFDWRVLVENGDIDVCNHAEILQTSVGFVLRKND